MPQLKSRAPGANVCSRAKLTAIAIFAAIALIALAQTAGAAEQCRDVFMQPVLTHGTLEATNTVRGRVAQFMRWLLNERYDIDVKGLIDVYANGDQKIVFLFEHPALVDPVILLSQTGDRFAPRPVVAESQNKGIRKLIFGKLKSFIVPEGGDNRAEVIAKLNDDILKDIASGGNVALAPSGQLKRTHLDEIRGKSMAAHIIQNLPPDARVVIVTNKGLFGSALSYGHTGSAPAPGSILTGEALVGLATRSLQKRKVEMTFEEIDSSTLAELRNQDRSEINDYLDSRINRIEQDNTFVPLRKNGKVIVLPDPIPEGQSTEAEKAAATAAAQEIPAELKAKLISALQDVLPEQSTEIPKLFHSETNGDVTSFGNELGLDSLGFVQLGMNLEDKLGFRFGSVQDGTPAEFLLQVYQASRETDSAPKKKRVDLRWFRFDQSQESKQIPQGDNVLDVLLQKAKENPDAPWMSDEKSGVMTYRDAIGKIMVLSRVIGKMKGQNIGLMLPPSVGGTLMYFATLKAGKVPVMVNYTAGNESLKYSMDLVGVKTILTSSEFVAKLAKKDLRVDSISEHFLFSEDLMKSMQERSWKNAGNLVLNGINLTRARFKSLWLRSSKGRGNKPAVILFTSGSSSNPKPVVLTNKNVLTNVRDIAPVFAMKSSDAVLGFAPFFHSLGLTGTLVMPALLGVRANYFPDATDGTGIAQAIDSHRSSMIIGPPALLRQIFSMGEPSQFDSLKYVLAGAAPLTQENADFLQSRARHAVIMEGAGATETSPVWAINPPGAARIGSVGKILKSITAHIVDNDSLTEAIESKDASKIKMITPDASGTRRGELVLSGDSVIEAYYNNLKPEAFFTWNGRKYYRTEDLVAIDKDNYVFIEGRFSRQHKTAGGEMINHQMIENALESMPALAPGQDGKPTFYIGSAKMNGESVTVLVTSKPVSMDDVNRHLGKTFSPTWFVKKMIITDTIPLLGTGKVDARSCNDLIKRETAP